MSRRRSRCDSLSSLPVAASRDRRSMTKMIVDHFKSRELQSVAAWSRVAGI